MPRIKRKRITVDVESLNNILQEIYNDSHNTRADIKGLFGKIAKVANNPTELAVLGHVMVNLINSEIKNNDHKMAIAKLIKDVLSQEAKKGTVTPEGEISTEEQSSILARVKKEIEEKQKK